MNIYDDYINYLSECMEVIDRLKITSSPLQILIDDVIKVTDYIYQKYDKKQKIDDDLEEIFSLGFGYLSNVLTYIKSYYEESFDKNMNKLNEYANLIINLVILDDFKSYLEANEFINDVILKELEDMMAKLDHMIATRGKIVSEIDESITLYIDEHTPQDAKYTPVYSVYAMIAEEISMTEDINL